MKLTAKKRHIRIMIMCLLSLSAFLMTGCFENPKNFSFDNATVTLSTAFKDRNNSEFDTYISSDDVVFTAKKETNHNLQNAGYEISSLADYCSEILSLNNMPASALIERGNYKYFTTSKTLSGAKYTYVYCMFQQKDAYWICNFVCKTKDYSRLEKKIFGWADSITFQ